MEGIGRVCEVEGRVGVCGWGLRGAGSRERGKRSDFDRF